MAETFYSPERKKDFCLHNSCWRIVSLEIWKVLHPQKSNLDVICQEGFLLTKLSFCSISFWTFFLINLQQSKSYFYLASPARPNEDFLLEIVIAQVYEHACTSL